MRRSLGFLASVMGAALVAISAPANAVTVQIVSNTEGTAYNLTAPVTYRAQDGIVSPGNFVHTYFFQYSPPPFVTATSLTIDNINPTDGSQVNITGFTFDWLKKVGASYVTQIVGPVSVGVSLTENISPTSPGLYELVLKGTAAAIFGGNYSLKITTATAAPPLATPLPGALVLFFTGLVGGAAAFRFSGKRRQSV